MNEEGYIVSFGPTSSEVSEAPDIEETLLPEGSFILPTFVDLHLHAPQFLYQGTGLHLPLMQWLDQYAYHAEERIDADPALAQRVYSRLASHLLELGTGAVLLFGTINEAAKSVSSPRFPCRSLRSLG